MANQWALLIGINQYTALQPLMYAQADAVSLRNFFVDELGIPVDQCRLLTDMSATVEPYAHHPLRREIESQLQLLCREKVEPGDVLWIFFSGYGLSNAGRDYWLPVDAEPMKLAETAIAVADIFDILKTAKTDQIFLTLDMNRSQGAVGHQNIGQQTLALANDFGVATVLSCQPEQYAHETMAIRHGLFTKALLEGLRYHGCVTVSQLAAYLSDRVPELSQHHWRPIQNPATAIPTARKFMMVVPPDGIARLPVTENVAASFSSADFATSRAESASAELGTAPFSDPEFTTSAPIRGDESVRVNQAMVPDPAAKWPAPTTSQLDLETVATAESPLEETPQSMALVPVSSVKEEEEDESSTRGFWKWLALAAAFSVLVGAFLRYQPIQFARGDRTDQSTSSAETTDDPELNPAAATADADATQSPDDAVAQPPPEDVEATPNTTTPDATASAPLFPNNIDSAEVGESALQRAEAAIAEGRYGQARAWLSQVPPEQRDETYDALLQQADSEEADAAVRNQQILNDARGIIQPSSASLFNDAIEQARQVPADDPYYEQAQADIARWSQVILDLAEGRANSGDIQGALAAAQLVPEDQAAIYQLAQERIAIWQTQIENQQLIQQMQDSLQPGQANTFQNAISALQQITPDQPGYATARERINQWSQDILIIARARAAQGEVAGAIAAAELVPENTDAYAQAMDEIQRWQEQI